MVRKCTVRSCPVSQRSHPGLPLFEFPKNEELKKIWVKNMKAENIKLLTNSCVCVLHFEDEYLLDHGNRVILKPGAVPTKIQPEVSEIAFIRCFY